jgi:hypothetical protein
MAYKKGANMADKEKEVPESFEVEELDDATLESVSGGVEPIEDVDNGCTNTNCDGANCGNCVAGCT